MSVIATSYEFHKSLESPIAFVRREWAAFLLFGGGFVLVLLFGILAVSPAYFYPRLETDPLLYYLKGLKFAESGSTAALYAINKPPFQYVAMPGILRSPLMMMFGEFDSQLRAIQLSNVVLVGITATLYAYVLSWAVPKKWHWMAIGFSFAFFLLSPEWVANVFQTLADAPYAFFATACLVLTERVLSSDKPMRERWGAIALALFCFAIAFLSRFTAPVLLVYAGVLAAGRKRHHQIPHRLVIAATAGALLILAALVGLNWETIRSRYLIEPYFFLTRAPKVDVTMNLLGLALPSQIISDFRLGFLQHPILSPYRVSFGPYTRDRILLAIGLITSALTLLGMWRSRKRFAPEIAYVLAAVPVLALMIPSTSRYLMAYQAFFWIFFYVGASAVVAPVFKRIDLSGRGPLIAVAAIVIAAGGLVLLRTTRVVGTVGTRAAAISLGKTRAYVGEVSSTFADTRRFLETLPRNRTLLIGMPGTIGRWKAISGLNYYRPDSAVSVAATKYQAYLLSECGTFEVCQNFDRWDGMFRQGMSRFGMFTFEPVFSRITQHAKVKVYRVRPQQ